MKTRRIHHLFLALFMAAPWVRLQAAVGVMKLPAGCETAFREVFTAPPAQFTRPLAGDTSEGRGQISIYDPHGEFEKVDIGLISAHLTAKYPEDASVEVLLGGGESFIILITREDGSTHIDKIPRHMAAGRQLFARAAFRREVDIVRRVGEKFGEEGKATVVTILHTDIDAAVPSISLKYANGGSLKSQLKILGPQASFENLAAVFAGTAKPLGFVHALNETHGDVKTANYLIEIQDGKIVAVRLADFGFSSQIGEPAIGYTPYYSRPITFRGKTRATDLNETSVQKDMYAHMVTLQEILLGKTLGEMLEANSPDVIAAKVTERVNNKGVRVDVHTPVLKKSPHSIDPRIPETLSTISWVEFKTAPQMQALLARAVENKDKPDVFYRKYFGPEILEKMPPEEAALLINGDDALKSRFYRSRWGVNGLGLSYRAWSNLRKWIPR